MAEADSMNSSLNSLLLFWDKSRRSFVLALRSLWLHKLRSFLSVLGIIIGTVSVIMLMSFGEGNMREALEDIKRQGATNVIIRSEKPVDDSSSQRRSMTANYGLTYADYDQLLLLNTIEGSVPMRMFPQEIRNLHRMFNGRVVGTTRAYRNVNRIELVEGRFLEDSDEIDEKTRERLERDGVELQGDNLHLKNVAVLGSDVAEALFPFQSAVDKSIVLNKHHFRVIGVLKERTPLTSAGGSAEDFNGEVYIPLSTCRGRYGEKIFIRQSGSRTGEQVELHQITLTISDMDKVRDAGEFVKSVLERSHGFKKDWKVIVPLDRLKQAEDAKQRYMILLFFIAAISLTVGGIGIMNIMLATVTERTREIGIRRALGAKRSDITLQFLIEALVQTSVGGMLGAVFGISLVYIVPWLSSTVFSRDLPAQLHHGSIGLSLVAAITVGVFFGLYPAFRASRLDPIEALRHD
jgi:putative ABC transport system permease protein